MGGSLPAISGNELIKVLVSDGWVEGKHSTHGAKLTKRIGNQTLVTIVPTKNDSLPIGTLMAILGTKQTCLGREGLLRLLGRG